MASVLPPPEPSLPFNRFGLMFFLFPYGYSFSFSDAPDDGMDCSSTSLFFVVDVLDDGPLVLLLAVTQLFSSEALVGFLFEAV